MSDVARLHPHSRSGPADAAVLNALPDPIIAVDAADRISFANAAAEEFFQASRSTLLRLKLNDLVHGASPLREAVEQVRLSASTITKYGVLIGTPRTGGERSIDVQAASVPEEPGSVVLILLGRSTAQKIDRQLTHRAAARSVTGLAAMLAHEIKNPLAGIRGAAQLLEPSLGEEDRSLARLICSETDRISALVDQMEVFSDERPPRRGPVNIHAVLDHVRALCEAGLGDFAVFRQDFDPSLPPLLGNRDQLVQVFLNLVKNACEAIRADGRSGEIVLSTAFRPGMKLRAGPLGEAVSLPLEVCVHDTGPGIADEVRPHIFEPFVTSKPGGRGLGLALVAKIIQDHGGIIECLPRERGTTFRMLLPMLRSGTPWPGDDMGAGE